MAFTTWKNKMYNVGSSLKRTILIIGTAGIVLAAFRNSLTWLLTQTWGVSHDLWQHLWIKVLEVFDHNPLHIYIIGTGIFTMVTYWCYNAFLLYIDLTGKPKFLQAYKIQEDKAVPVDRKKVLDTAFVVLKNQFISSCILTLMYPLMMQRKMPWGVPLPTFQRVLFELACFIIVEEIGFYYAHRLLHHPKLYKHIHKMHHEWTAPISIVGIYAHPVEHILSNVLPVLTGPFIMGSHVATMWLWILMASLNTSNSHCGYHFPSFPSPEQHDYHHLKFNQCYGVLGILDRLHNTDAQFRASKNYQRHIMHFSLKPIKEVFPDEPKQKHPPLNE